MSINVGDRYDEFEVVSVEMKSAVDDFITLAGWFAEDRSAEHQAAANELYQWYIHADNKGSLGFHYINKVG